ncbi:DNA polymerase III subunit gamma/tau [Nitrosococcus oceani]|uniref:DNA polymerase III subunit gamma/tau n=2 Tax=Nitrosococcus oceani TaxID=1229 RepID=Q3J800_NITOC|nr:DNA polymerase III subunit gamma/tau [Nitrosococcus oceani]KFI18569.1 DNA polymerase III subunit gamma/tau [Nitrosococcus oceani C-27]ABA59046.1 DNA polymerase III, gamma subunit / DNA polymerase III, tau subunit [Nitrosococcus oceani ATCC 19707]EDZ65321.1 DNA polymerase III, subunits gamma and tau, putative [Nitrosococcus oceani AFC27]KFI21797.1 DNA polymerase III subunit gamma/tau [Nitrosococcus oceani]GEM21191.1 DNA polymerase III, subunit gamma and tau [Nitrosococcus oceani]
MSYQVLARKWRPRDFTQVVGQEHVVRALTNGLDKGRLHHAFLFTGTRGVGKTTLARILAKSLNCKEGVRSTPCGKCQNCQAIDGGNFVDLIEVDAASRTGVDDTRELLENVHYAPSRGHYKVYLIDEVHMFSTSSFNALLKTLEEPPPHIKFLLATTEPKKLPVTVLSRCLQFNLRRITPKAIAEHLNSILEAEEIPSESYALTLIARAAEGSVRDALSLLDQAINYGRGQVMVADVRTMLGSIEQGDLFILLDALLAGNGQGLIEKVREICAYSVDISSILADLLHLLQRLALYQLAPDTVDDIDERGIFSSLAARTTPEEVQLFYQIGLIGSRDLTYAPDHHTAFEMILLRMLCFRPADGASSCQALTNPKPEKTGLASSDPPLAQETTSPPLSGNDHWPGLVTQLKLTAIARQLAENCALERREEGIIYLQLAPSMANLHSKRAEERLQQALEEYYGEAIQLIIRIADSTLGTDTVASRRKQEDATWQQAAVESIQNDANIKALSETFNARLPLDSVRPLTKPKQE